MNPLESRKQLLIAESELNRAQLAGDVAALAADVRALTGRARSLGLIASSAASLISGLMSFRRKKSTPADGDVKPSWLQTILKGAGLVSTIWKTVRPSDRDPDGI